MSVHAIRSKTMATGSTAATASTAAKATNGRSYPLGVVLDSGGANFCVFAQHATSVELLLFDRADDPRPKRVIRLDPVQNRTFYYWHTFLPGVEEGQIYGYRVSDRLIPRARPSFRQLKGAAGPLFTRGRVW